MSEQLKSYKMIDESYCCGPFSVEPADVYIKSDVDKLIAELNMRICEGDEDFEIANNQINRLLKIVRHQKYKRCLVMAEQCKESLRLMRVYEVNDDYWNLEPGHDAEYFCKKCDFYSKWRKRWLKLAEQFKEAKCRERWCRRKRMPR